MKCSFKNIVIVTLIIRLFVSCSAERNIVKIRNEDKLYINYLSSIVNDTLCFEIPELVIIDSTIYSVLDSAILLSERCQYFDSKVKYLNSFRFAANYGEDNPYYLINANLSPAKAIGLDIVEAGFQKHLNIGVFYYKHYMFAIPIGNYKGQKDLEYFPFVKKVGRILKIQAPKFFDEKDYSSYITFNKFNDKFIIKENKICGNEILIR